jgi:polyferredoxin
MNEIIEQEKNNKELSKKSWIDNLKDQSWEAELLVSAIAIFGTFQLFSGIDWWVNAFINVLNPSQYFIGYMIVFFGLLAVSILVAMFVIHFFLRSYWIGLIGLNSVFLRLQY